MMKNGVWVFLKIFILTFLSTAPRLAWAGSEGDEKAKTSVRVGSVSVGYSYHERTARTPLNQLSVGFQHTVIDPNEGPLFFVSDLSDQFSMAGKDEWREKNIIGVEAKNDLHVGIPIVGPLFVGGNLNIGGLGHFYPEKIGYSEKAGRPIWMGAEMPGGFSSRIGPEVGALWQMDPGSPITAVFLAGGFHQSANLLGRLPADGQAVYGKLLVVGDQTLVAYAEGSHLWSPEGGAVDEVALGIQRRWGPAVVGLEGKLQKSQSYQGGPTESMKQIKVKTGISF